MSKDFIKRDSENDMGNAAEREMELYLHIPFCVKKCAYCDFLSGPSDEKVRQEYVDALIREIASYQSLYSDRQIVTIFLGGGTPSILSKEQIVTIFHALRETFCIASDCEITIEMNPGTVTKEKLLVYREVGINRLSIGLQSVHDEELRLLGRIHTFKEFLSTYEQAREVGFQNVNIDLISAIPGQTVESWEKSLRTIAELNPEHISAYSLIVEEGTPFYEQYADGQGLPNEEDEREMYQSTVKILREYGYDRYEVSNYAKPGYECKHNLGYWNRVSYLGIGTGAASLIRQGELKKQEVPCEVRYEHVRDREEYIRILQEGSKEEIHRRLEQNREVLTRQMQMEEFMFLGLRRMQGISYRRFWKCFGVDIQSVYGEVIQKLKEQELLQMKEDRIFLTKRGIDISNYVLGEFLLP